MLRTPSFASGSPVLLHPAATRATLLPMAGHEYQPVRPKAHLAPDGVELRNRVMAGSPLAVQGIFLEALREYFMQPDAPFRWDTDANSGEILIEAGANPLPEENNPSRGIFVVRAGSDATKIMLGDRMGIDIPTGQEGFYANMVTAFEIECVSAAKGECEVLGDFVQHFLIASRRIIEAQYGFQEMTMASMSAVGQYQYDTRYYSVTLRFNTTHAFRWTTVRIAPTLNQLVVHMKTRMGHSPQPGTPADLAEQASDALFAQSAFDSLTRNVPQRPDRIPPPDRT